MVNRMRGEKSPKMTLRSSAGPKASRSHAASVAYRSLAGSLASKKSQAGSSKSIPASVASKRSQTGSLRSLPALPVAEKSLASSTAAISFGNSKKSEKALKKPSSKKRSKQMGEKTQPIASRRCPIPRTLAHSGGSAQQPVPRGRARDNNVLASSLGELVATGVLRADNAALLMTITPDLTLDTVLGPSQILQLATTLRLYTKLETESKKSAASAIEKILLNMSGTCAAGQPGAVDLISPDAVPWDTMVEPWVCQPDPNGFIEGRGGLPVILEDSPGVHSPLEDSRSAGHSKGRDPIMSSADSVDASKTSSKISSHRGSKEKRGRSRGRNTSGDNLTPRERARSHVQRRYRNEEGPKMNVDSRAVDAESRSQSRSVHTRRTAPGGSVGTTSIAQGSLDTRDSTRWGGSLLDHRSSSSHMVAERSISTVKARSGSRGRASSRQRNQDFSGSVSIITGDSSRDSGRSRERRRWGSTERNMTKEEPDHQENGRKGQGLLRMFGIVVGNKTPEADDDSEEEDYDDEEEEEEEEDTLTVEGSVDILQRKKTLKNWMERRKKNKQPPLEKRVHHLLAAGREKKADKKEHDGDDQGGILETGSEDQSSTGSLNTFTSIPSQVVVIGEAVETPAAASSTAVQDADLKSEPSPDLRPDPDGRKSVPVDNDSLDQLRRLFHVKDLPELEDGTIETETSHKTGVEKWREDLISKIRGSGGDAIEKDTATIDPLQIYESQHNENQQERAKPLNDSRKLQLAQKRCDETMKLLMSFSKSEVTTDGSGSNSSVASDDSNSTENEGSLVEAIATELLETSSLRHILLGSGLTRQLKKPTPIRTRKQQMENTAVAPIVGRNHDVLARTYSDISREAAMQGCASAMGVGCDRPCPVPSYDPNQSLSPTTEKKSTHFFLELQHVERQQQHQLQRPQHRQQQQQPQPQQDNRSTASHGSNTVPTTAATSDSSCSATTAGQGISSLADDNKNSNKKKKNGNKNKEAASPGFWNWLSG